MKNQLLLATHNPGKVVEFSDLLKEFNIDWLTLGDLDLTVRIAETGKTFHENAVLKATGYARLTGLYTLADDSGLEVDALDGSPGVHTARFGGPGLTAVDRYEFLLKRLENIPLDRRGARFRCVVALADPFGALVATAEGTCGGLIALQPSGEGGFGYDPVFYLPDMGITMAQLPANEKHKISHRGKAIKRICPQLKVVISGSGL